MALTLETNKSNHRSRGSAVDEEGRAFFVLTWLLTARIYISDDQKPRVVIELFYFRLGFGRNSVVNIMNGQSAILFAGHDF